MNMSVVTPFSAVGEACPIGKEARSLWDEKFQPVLTPVHLEKGEYARSLDGVVYIMDGGDSGYWVVRTEREDQCFYRPYDLIPWSPLPGDHVIEAGSEDAPVGLVVEASDGSVQVKWPRFNRLQTWLNTNLEPAWDHK